MDTIKPLARFLVLGLVVTFGCGKRGPSAAEKQNVAKQLALAVIETEAAYNDFDRLNRKDADGKLILSWRVSILPYIEQRAIYDRMHLEKPWDSSENRKLTATVIQLYETEYAPTPGTTTWKLIPNKRGGVLLVEGGEGSAVPWAEPDEVKVDGNDPLISFGKEPPAGFTVVLADGVVKTMKGPQLKAMLLQKE